MYILTPDNKSFNTVKIPDKVTDLYFCVLDYSDPEDIDYRFLPIVFVENFPKANAVLKIGENEVEVPLHWSILIGDRDFGELELMPIIEFHGRDFSAFTFNPCKGFMSTFEPIEIINIYQEVKWCIPTVMPDHLLTVPLRSGDNPPCAFFAEPKIKLPDGLDIRDLI